MDFLKINIYFIKITVNVILKNVDAGKDLVQLQIKVGQTQQIIFILSLQIGLLLTLNILELLTI